MDEESSSNLSGFTGIIQAYWPYSLIYFQPFCCAVSRICSIWKQKFSALGQRCGVSPVYRYAVVLAAGRQRCSSSFPALFRFIFFYIHSLMCSVSPVTCHRGICMTRCRTWARYEASLTKSPRHPVKSKTHLDKVTERKKKKKSWIWYAIAL